MAADTDIAALDELARQRDLHKYYQPWLDSGSLKTVPVNHHPEKRSNVHASHDTTLTALAQLATLRLNVKRGMVSLITTDTQIILAEATQSLSLVDDTRHAPGDHIWLGNVSAPRKDCVDEHVFGAKWQTTTEEGEERSLCALVINDLRKDNRFKNRPYVLAEPAVRFYAGVPIVTRQGYEIGVYAVSDDKPRPEGLCLDQILYLQDVAEIVANHLERVKSMIEKERDETFLNGFSTFIDDLSALKHQDRDPIDHMQRQNDAEQTDTRATDPQDEPSQAAKEAAESKYSAGESTNDIEGQDTHLVPRHTRTTEGLNKEDSGMMTSDVRQVFARASATIRDGIGAQGCIFLDTSSGSFSPSPDQGFSQAPSSEPQLDLQDVYSDDWPSEDDAPLHDPATTNGGGADQEESFHLATDHEMGKMADVLGASLAEPTKVNPSKLIRRKHLKQWLMRYPRGQCFFLDRNGITRNTASNSDRASTSGGNNHDRLFRATSIASGRIISSPTSHVKRIPRQLMAQIPEAKWIIILPLYNFAQRQWFATGIIWWNEPNIGDPEASMPYLKTFGSCIMSEVTSMEAFNTSTAKSTFIASISHDLRSPLHGLLGSLEFLEDTMTSAYQMSLVDSIQTCGKTLLDTIDHLLDYAKINNLNRAGSDPSATISRTATYHTEEPGDSPSDDSHIPVFDLAMLLEEVVEAVFAGQTFRMTRLRRRDPVDDAAKQIQKIGLDDSESTNQQIHSGSEKFSGKVFFILDIDNTKSWRMRGQTGALRRVIMNIVGNAIKYCQVGCIEILLNMKQTGPSHADVEISVKDTGVGMSQRFLQNHLFKAFSQEDSFTPGAGLGLSITSRIVQGLNGKIRVDSEKGVGTDVKVVLPMQLAPQSACDEDEVLRSTARVTAGKKVCMLNLLSEEQQPSPGQISRLTASISKTCEEWFQMTCCESKSIDEVDDASVFVYCEPPPIEYLLEHHSERKAVGKGGEEAVLLIICTNAFEAAALRAAGVAHLTSLGRIVEVISQPVGARKLAKVLLQSLQRVEATSTNQGSKVPANARKQPFGTGEAQQRASEIEWNTSSTVYDQEIAKYRPSVQTFKWKSEQPLTSHNSHDASRESDATFGNIKAGVLPGMGSIPHKDAAPTNGESRPPHVLVVDDNSINLKLLVTSMKKIKLPYAEAINGLDAFTKFKEAKEAPFDFVLMDLQMPVMDGLESTRKIREYERQSQSKKPATIIAITGVGSESVRKECMDAGMTLFLTKPIKFKILHQLLEQHRNHD
ncbi:hypothetical protein LTR70_004765 [Exophiala xenobiotica]|uniref:Histidine kinase n=1 Tax=Lithohypha guttulata TaxID=1690604 RepID=A0ABR0KCB9_9EURO|nr:hypothetical protein LTR24_004257 [Lithohypha guttulata]KAK5319855.1 hypothetical protein LTR70_004765 [Exophiala xenobiotica]